MLAWHQLDAPVCLLRPSAPGGEGEASEEAAGAFEGVADALVVRPCFLLPLLKSWAAHYCRGRPACCVAVCTVSRNPRHPTRKSLNVCT